MQIQANSDELVRQNSSKVRQRIDEYFRQFAIFIDELRVSRNLGVNVGTKVGADVCADVGADVCASVGADVGPDKHMPKVSLITVLSVTSGVVR